jgi:flagellar protein FlgJ
MAMNSADTVTPRLSADVQALGDLKRAAAQDPAKALKATAQQFETLFMNMLMKSMRDAMPKDDMLSSSGGDMYTGMFDQQIAQKMAARGTGIADMIVKQLGRQMNAKNPADVNVAGADAASASTANAARTSPASTTAAPSGTANAPKAKGALVRFEKEGSLSAQITRLAKSAVQPAVLPSSDTTNAKNAASGTSREFLEKMWSHAVEAEQATGLPAKFMIGQAALETGWGKREITHADGTPAYNLFGIKAGSNWSGPTVNVTTTEYVNGVAKKVVEKFRAYASYAESFRDYAAMLANSPRYAQVVKTAGASVERFAAGLQRAGYATDPQYADKLTKTINNLLAFQRSDRQA